MARTLTRNHDHFRRALTRLPLGVASNFRFWGEDRTIYVKQGRGARVTDLDGNVYVDYRMGYGPAILGYADPRVDAAARAGMEVGGVFALSTVVPTSRIVPPAPPPPAPPAPPTPPVPPEPPVAPAPPWCVGRWSRRSPPTPEGTWPPVITRST